MLDSWDLHEDRKQGKPEAEEWKLMRYHEVKFFGLLIKTDASHANRNNRMSSSCHHWQDFISQVWHILKPRKHFLLIILLTIRPNLCQRVWLLWSYFAFWYPMPSFVRWGIFMNLWSCDLWPLLETKAVRTQGHDHWWTRYLHRAIEDSCYIFSWKQLFMQLDSPPSHPASVHCQIELALSLEYYP